MELYGYDDAALVAIYASLLDDASAAHCLIKTGA